MGPRPFGRGRRPAARAALGVGRRFNGAATFRSRKVGELWLPSTPRSSLQWGRDLSVAEGGRRPGRQNRTITLQWGRDLSVAEGGSRTPTPARPAGLQWGRDLSVAEGPCCTTLLRRRPRLQWGRDLSVAEGERSWPSYHVASRLQWGRDLSVAEGLRLNAGELELVGRFNGAATFRSRKAHLPVRY